MAINVAKEVATLRHMAVRELHDRYHEVFGENTNARNKQWLIKRIAWKLQANAEGDISDRARRLTSNIKFLWLSDFTPLAPQSNGHRWRPKYAKFLTV